MELKIGSRKWFKARPMAKDFHQNVGTGFKETFNPVIKHATIRLVLYIAVIHHRPIKQTDINNSFLKWNTVCICLHDANRRFC